MQATNRQTANVDAEADSALDEAAAYVVEVNAIMALPFDRQEEALQAREQRQQAARAAHGWTSAVPQIQRRTSRRVDKAAQHEARYPAGYKPEPLPVPELLRRWANRRQVARIEACRHARQYGGGEEYRAWLAPGWKKATPRGNAPRHYLAEATPEDLAKHLRRLHPCDCEICARKLRQSD